MSQEHSIHLSNSVEVKLYPHKKSLEDMLDIVNGPDFLEETEIMKAVSNFPPMSLLFYDEFLALGVYSMDGDVTVGMQPYSEKMMLQWVDMALSLRKRPIRVTEKTTKSGEMFRRLKPRIDLDFIEYDPKSKVIRERETRYFALLRSICNQCLRQRI